MNTEQIITGIESVRPRPFDTYILPLFMAGYAFKSKAPMGRWARRILFTAGVYMFYRNFSEYRKSYESIAGAND